MSPNIWFGKYFLKANSVLRVRPWKAKVIHQNLAVVEERKSLMLNILRNQDPSSHSSAATPMWQWTLIWSQFLHHTWTRNRSDVLHLVPIRNVTSWFLRHWRLEITMVGVFMWWILANVINCNTFCFHFLLVVLYIEHKESIVLGKHWATLFIIFYIETGL
jgi:hypothetical protein